jgi:hypothetical protein
MVIVVMVMSAMSIVDAAGAGEKLQFTCSASSRFFLSQEHAFSPENFENVCL